MEAVTSNKSLYQINLEMLELAARIEDAEGVLDEQMEKALMIGEKELTEKAANYAFIIMQYEDRSAAIDREIKRLQALKKPVDNTIKRLKENVQTAMEMHGITKIETDTVRLSFRKSSRLIAITDSPIDALRAEFKIEEVIVKADTKKITDALKAGEQVMGYELREFNNLQIK